ncbi:glycosyltransferase family 2 protein [Aeromicrobium sp. Leaf350]|uniref:glycosyltransferase family 2 protein n=1 Tax=Aeromicrobium sp. Leaf350 TaxID=2876565 RepID=UPI001E4E66D1|nr:glycosyltransferase family 2 protein [Aeromicrobium sp. Leaf350]
MSQPTVSVVVPAYNNGRFLAETIDSVLSQEGVDFELIVADHASTDDTRSVMDRYADDPRVRLLDTPAGGGAPANWKRVSDEASGELIKLVCGDDTLRPGVLRRQAELLRARPAAVLTACRRDVIDSTSTTLLAGRGLQKIDKPSSGPEAVRRAVRSGVNPFGEPASVMMRRSALTEAGGWFPEFPYLIDQGTYCRVLLHGDFVPDTETGATFRMSSEQWSVVLVKQQSDQAKGFYRWLHEHHPDVVSANDLRVGSLRAALAARMRRLAYAVLRRRMR